MIIDILSWICLVAGGLLGMIGAIGMLRFPDFYSRQHAAGVSDVLCAMFILLGLGLQAGFGLTLIKLAFIFIFLFVTSPAASHAAANAAMHTGLKPLLDDDGRRNAS